MTRLTVTAVLVVLLSACGGAPTESIAQQSHPAEPVITAGTTAPALDATPAPTADRIDDGAASLTEDGPAPFGLPTVDADTHLLEHPWTFPGGGATLRPLTEVPTGLLDPDAARQALATGLAAPPTGEPFLATRATSTQPATLVWAVVWTADGSFSPPPPPPPPGQPTPPLATISIFANLIDAHTGAPLEQYISSR